MVKTHPKELLFETLLIFFAISRRDFFLKWRMYGESSISVLEDCEVILEPEKFRNFIQEVDESKLNKKDLKILLLRINAALAKHCKGPLGAQYHVVNSKFGLEKVANLILRS